MDIGEFRRRIVEYREGVVPRSATDGFLGELLEALDDDGPPVDVDDGFVILPVTRYEALREAEEALQETRFEPADDGEADEAALARRVDELRGINEDLHGLLREQAAENGRLKEAAKAQAGEAIPRPGPTAREYTLHPVLDKHLQDLQAEIDGIKSRLDAQDKAVGEALGTIFDRLGVMTARLNKLDAREVART
jgi:hypothetical protein